MPSLPIIVYLDSQDYSRLAKVELGDGDHQSTEVYEYLKNKVSLGEIVCVYSATHLGELLRYDQTYRNEMFAKAKVIEKLSRGQACIFPERLIASELATALTSEGHPDLRPLRILERGNYWHPSIGDALNGFENRLRVNLLERIDSTVGASRATRRIAKSKARKLDLSEPIDEISGKFADEYELPVATIRKAIGPFLRGKISSDVASKRFFEPVARPSNFAKIYYEKLEPDDRFPKWLSESGFKLKSALDRLKSQLLPIMQGNHEKKIFKDLLSEHQGEWATLILGIGDEALQEVGLDKRATHIFESEPALLKNVPAARMLEAVVPEIILQSVGVTAYPSKVEHSLAGDLVHALYLPYVDVWRGDRRFSHILRSQMPSHRGQICSRLNQLMAVIDQHIASS